MDRSQLISNKLIAIGIIIGALVFSTPAFGAVSIENIGIQAETPTTSRVSVYFAGSAPYTLLRSDDGQNWTTLVTGNTSGYYVDDERQNYINYYYKVTDNAGTSKIAAAYPPDTNPHLPASSTFAPCAGCHVTHTAVGPKLLTQQTIVDLCTTCHDGTQSKYDVRNGKVNTGTGWADTGAGPFGALNAEIPVEEFVYEGYRSDSTQAVVYSPTSIHNLGTPIEQAPGGVSQRIDGISCADCHEPHGSDNYRNLRESIFVANDVYVQVDFKAFAKTDPAKINGFGEKVYYQSGSIFFCASCHSDFNQATGSGSQAATSTAQPNLTLSPESMNNYMHAVNTPMIMYDEYLTSTLPVETGTGVNTVVCLTCHFPHGTTRVGKSKVVNSTALIRMDKQGICEDCHQK